MTKQKSITHSRKFRVRYYESDPNGLLSCPNYLRFMQETAFDASSASGYDWDQYQKMNRVWVIRDTQLHALEPVFYNQTLLVKTWIAGFQGITSRRKYAFYRLEDDTSIKPELVARGYSDWVFLDTKNSRPVNIPKELQLRFFPDGLPETFHRRRRFSLKNNLPDNVFTQKQQVNIQDIDQLQHMNNASYMDYVRETNWRMFERQGFSFVSLQQEQKTLLPYLSRIRYKVPAHYGDKILVSTWISNLSVSKFAVDFMIHRESDNTLFVQGQLQFSYFDLESKIPRAIPRLLQNSLKQSTA
jgi:acyl-CoA thioester hydrolase